ncbi:hypothetical protein AMTR_s00139p00058880 [Amborella trichopoda]|uniref:Reverse transcriptase RNase H-like domain-containing protein n=1 Tax=Amborella trichopoda TaxID=13333 RepID=W1NFC7_AMBTC|nr:hypothetical protein AMTR_s00139p00058880 [Amborella trichopoda]
MVLEYKPEKTNQVTDSLSRKAELAAMKIEAVATIERIQSTLPDRIMEGLENDALAKTLMEQAREGTTQRFRIKEGFLITKGHRIF